MFYILTKAVQLIPTEADSVKYFLFKNSFQKFENRIYNYNGIKDLMSLVVDANEYSVNGKNYKFNDVLDLPENVNEIDVVLYTTNNSLVLFRFTKF